MKSKKNKSCLRGSFTIEAALLMTVLLPVMVALIYMAFFLHDRALLQGAACEAAAMGSNLSEENDAQKRIDQLEKQLVTSRLMGTGEVRSAAVLSRNRVEISYQGNFSVPGLIANLFGGAKRGIQRSWSRELFHPADTIRKIRGLEYLADSIKR